MSFRLTSPIWPLAVMAMVATSTRAADAPLDLGPVTWHNVTAMPDGTLRRLRGTSGQVRYQTSTDNGVTWGPDTLWFSSLGSWVGTNPVTTFDADGNAHVFQFAKPSAGAPSTQLNAYHYGENAAFASQLVYEGRIGSIINAINTSSGRLILPLGDANGFTTAAWSADRGLTWTVSPSVLTIAPAPNFNGALNGAVEPAVIEKNNGDIWMLMRTQSHRLGQSTSSDGGATWSPATNAAFHTTTGPPNLLRLADGRMMLVWNNARMPEKYNGAGWYGGRDVLHAAISNDDGVTWRGFREIYLDPNRNLDPVADGITGDSGTAYPFIAEAGNGRVVMIAGQTPSPSPLPEGWVPAHRQFIIDPDWLEETTRREDFESANAIDHLSVFRTYGNVTSFRRHREPSADIVDDPNAAGKALRLRRVDSTNDGDGATWNFPALVSGKASLRLRLADGFAGASIGLTDRFFNPTDPRGEELSYFKLDIAGDRMIGAEALSPGQWYDLSIDYNAARQKAIVRINGQRLAVLDPQASAGTGALAVEYLHGLSYLRLRSTAPGADSAGFLVDDLSSLSLVEAVRTTGAAADARLGGADGWTAIRFDDYVPNQNVSPTNASGNGPTGVFASPFGGFVAPSTGAAAVGVQVATTDANIVFTDGTSLAVTSDITGAKNGGSLTITFVDPGNPSAPAAVSGVAFRFGSTLADNVSVTLLDALGREIPDFDLSALPATVTGAGIAWTTERDGQIVAAIHQVVLSGAGSDAWLLGSFALDSSLGDLAFTGFTTDIVDYYAVPEPGLLATICGAMLVMIRRRRRA